MKTALALLFTLLVIGCAVLLPGRILSRRIRTQLDVPAAQTGEPYLLRVNSSDMAIAARLRLLSSAGTFEIDVPVSDPGAEKALAVQLSALLQEGLLTQTLFDAFQLAAAPVQTSYSYAYEEASHAGCLLLNAWYRSADDAATLIVEYELQTQKIYALTMFDNSDDAQYVHGLASDEEGYAARWADYLGLAQGEDKWGVSLTTDGSRRSFPMTDGVTTVRFILEREEHALFWFLTS